MATNSTIKSKLLSFILLFFLILTGNANSQSLPVVMLKNTDGKTVNASDILTNSKPLLLIFWTISNRQSCNNLKAIVEAIQDTIGMEKVKVVAVCNGEPGNNLNAFSWIKGSGLDVELFFDNNGELSREMGIKAPFTMLYNSRMQLICKQAGYCSGSDAVVCSKIRECIEDQMNGNQ